ncbi:hypothetical protein C2845_PM11G04750 [Panicum miliaceum]|uniref:Replication factor A C-terminal domain-containing protein n=1 Tax=Panicum miliaceum TaxID=4540 RepID=A0A3L6RQE0_PANMI|nr:hypothetical protein C2845_PM11G04750 [Panicum miliaceum]
MAVDLSRGAVAAMSEQPPALRPVLQVADVQQLPWLSRSAASTPRCRLVLSDGVHCLQGLLVSGLAHLVADGALRRGTVLRLLEYQCSTLQDSTGMIYAVVSHEAGEELFGCKAKELYSLKHEKRDHAQFDDIIQRVLFQEYLWMLKAETETFNDEQLAKCTIIKAEKVNPSTESHHLLRVIGMLLPEGSGSTSANRGMAAELPWKTAAEITNVLGYLVQPELVIVKATLSIINTASFCYAACPFVVNGSQCGREAARNSDGWWHCNSCNQTFVTCDYRYRILSQL